MVDITWSIVFTLSSSDTFANNYVLNKTPDLVILFDKLYVAQHTRIWIAYAQA